MNDMDTLIDQLKNLDGADLSKSEMDALWSVTNRLSYEFESESQHRARAMAIEDNINRRAAVAADYLPATR